MTPSPISPPITPRRAVAADSARLAALGRASFIETFGHLYPAADLEAFLDANHAPERYAEWISDSTRALWIAEREGEAVAYAYAGPCTLPHPEVTAECGELKRLYLLKAVQGLGLGTRLLDAALEHLARPDRGLWIGVWSENRRAQRLYERRGFKKVGEYLFPVGETLDREFILRR